jgi:small GTP-binding protein
MTQKEFLKDYDYCHKVVVVGDSNVGKTSLLRRYVDQVDPIKQHLTTIGVDFKMKTLQLPELGGKVVKMQLWDTAGQERFDALSKSFWRGARGIIILFAVDNRDSYEHAKSNWFPSVKELTHETCEYVVLVGNKCDLGGVTLYENTTAKPGTETDDDPEFVTTTTAESKRRVAKEEATAWADENGMVYVETSALTNENVDVMFYRFCVK